MQKFIKNITIFLVLLFIINAGFYIGIKDIYWREYRKVNLTYRTYLLADSHGLPLDNYTEKYGIYNFSAGSDSYFDMKRKVEFLLKNAKVDTIIITVDDHTLSAYREKLNNLDRSSYFASSADFSDYYSMCKQKYLAGYCMFFNPKGGAAMLQYFKSSVQRFLSRAEKNKKEWSRLTEKERQDASHERMLMQFPDSIRSGSLATSLEEIIRLCHQNNITLIGLKFPVSRTYYDFVKGKSYGASDIFNFNGLKVLDISAKFKDRDDFFENQDHLNATGGKGAVLILVDSLKANR